MLNGVFGTLALLSLLLLLWQWLAARRFPLHRRLPPTDFHPGVTLLKPLKGSDPFTEACLRTWFEQDYPGPIQILFAVASADDPVCAIVRDLIQHFPDRDAQLIICGPLRGANAKVSKLCEIEKLARHDLLVISDADVKAPPDYLRNAVAPLQNPQTGLVNSFYILANPTTSAMTWEAFAINVDFWSQVLQACSLKPMDFALGAVMLIRRQQLREIGGFEALADCLADDYQLGNRIRRRGYKLEICPVVVECWSHPMGWREVWNHQLRWARTVRVCQPVPYFFSILSNPTLWPLLWFLASFSSSSSFSSSTLLSASFLLLCLATRFLFSRDLYRRVSSVQCSVISLSKPTSSIEHPETSAPNHKSSIINHKFLLPFLKDLLQLPIWAGAFLGNTIEWRGQKMKLRPDGTLTPARSASSISKSEIINPNS